MLNGICLALLARHKPARDNTLTLAIDGMVSTLTYHALITFPPAGLRNAPNPSSFDQPV
jgi:hypothetical protein